MSRLQRLPFSFSMLFSLILIGLNASAASKKVFYSCQGGFEVQVAMNMPAEAPSDLSELRGRITVELINGFPPITLVEKPFTTAIEEGTLALTSRPDGEFKRVATLSVPLSFRTLPSFSAALTVTSKGKVFIERDVICKLEQEQ